MTNRLSVLICVCATAFGAVVEEDVEIQGNYLEFRVAPADGAGVEKFAYPGAPNASGGDGLLLEGFGIGNFYVPNRRLNERLEIVESIADRPVLRYTYECDGPNIRGLYVTRTMEPLPDEASVRVTLRIDNKGDEDQWVAPWIRNELRPGGAFDTHDAIDVPTTRGILRPKHNSYHVAARNWFAATDTITKDTVYGVFNCDQTFAMLVERSEDAPFCAIQTAFVPRLIKAGASWETTYRLNVARGLAHVDFASDELAAQLDYAEGRLVLLLASARALPGLEIQASVRGPAEHQVWRLEPKRFDLKPGTLVRCTWEWQPAGDAPYEFLAKLTQAGRDLLLGRDTGSPHGGMDTQFLVGQPAQVALEPWTDAPYALEQAGRKLRRAMAVDSDTAIWFESSLEKIFPKDSVEPTGTVQSTAHLQMARNERESFQVLIRPPEGVNLDELTIRADDLLQQGGSGRITAEHIRFYHVRHYPVRVPTHFEGPTGDWPDPLPPLEPLLARGGVCTAVWVTVHAPADIPAGTYAGQLTLVSPDLGLIPLGLELEIFNFDLPATPALKTDFGFWPEGAIALCKRFGYAGSDAALLDAYLASAREHRVTLRALAQMPAESADYPAALSQYETRLRSLLEAGASTIAVPASLLDVPDQLAMANAFVAKHNLRDRVFSQIADEPERPAWPRLFDRMVRWTELAPDIPLMLTTYGTQPFFHEACHIWAIHTPVLDTANNRSVLERIAAGHEVWWYVNHIPPRPYANFFIDFAGIEHRVLFWQTWALGIKGLHYWGANVSQPGENPWVSQLDVTPANGDGFLIYPGPSGPISSIRWEIIRDGVEDYDYLVVFRKYMKEVEAKGPSDLLQRAQEAYNLKAIVPDLVSFARDPNVLLAKRAELGRLIPRLAAAAR